jgi:hypothetical protein
LTLICTVISDLGIIQASDSNLTARGGAVRHGPKVFPLTFGPGALALAGRYSVAGEATDTWMPECIRAYSAAVNPAVADFAVHLADRLTNEMTSAEKNDMSLIHIAGYVDAPEGPHPEMYFVRNVQGVDPNTGAYVGVLDRFLVSEDFWNRDYNSDDTKAALRSGGSFRYFNGFHPGRIAFLGFSNMLWAVFEQIWTHPDWKFRRPKTLDELASIVEMQLRTVGTLFESSDYDAAYIGGPIQIETILPPLGAIALG